MEEDMITEDKLRESRDMKAASKIKGGISFQMITLILRVI